MMESLTGAQRGIFNAFLMAVNGAALLRVEARRRGMRTALMDQDVHD